MRRLPMRKLNRPHQRQLGLLLDVREPHHPSDEVLEALTDALADLLLEVLRKESREDLDKHGGLNESEDND
jgi:hypothetical protein